ncbi:MAG: helix-turn-helix transcriptional regulator [Agathobacter sp.]|nr:helix-turn-helix transcriptional regulator [Agathobacter sp.]
MKTHEDICFFLENLHNLTGVTSKLVSNTENNKLENYIQEAPSVLVSYLYNRFYNLDIKEKLIAQQIVHIKYSLGIEFIYIPVAEEQFIALGPFTSDFLSADEIEGRLLGAGLSLTPSLYRFFSRELPILPSNKKDALLQLFFQFFHIPKAHQDITFLYLPGDNKIYPQTNQLTDLAEHEKMLYRYEESLAIAKCVTEGDYTKCMELLKTALEYQIPHQYSDDNKMNETITAARVGGLFYFSAVKGGLSPLNAEYIYMKYIREILSANSTDAVRELSRNMLHSFCDAVKNSQATKYSAFIQKIANYLSLIGGEELNPDEMSHIFKKPMHILEKEFRKETGITIKQYHRKVRLHRAAVLLKETTLPISQIAMQTGFLDQNYFARQFKLHYHCSPSEYRYNSNIH